MQADLREVAGLAARQRLYARRVMAELSVKVRSTEQARDAVVRREREARARLDSATAEAARVEARRQEVRRRVGALQAGVEGIRGRETYRDGVQLEPLRRQARDAEKSSPQEQRRE